MFWHKGQLIYNGKYQIEKQLGFGGFALTYKATHTQLNRPVVIKTPNISVQNDPEYPKYVERFKKEAQMLAQCCSEPHPHIVQIFDFFEVDGRFCLEMQYIEGLSLWDYVRNKGKLPEAEAIKYIQQIGLALIEVHKNGIFHLDVTPPNIMLTGDTGLTNSGKAVLIDFGIAGDMSPPSTLSRTFGNKAFAPYHELRKGIREASIDVYCLAASLYYAVTGEQPTNALDRKLDDEELIAPKQLVPNLSDIVNNGILQGLALEAKDRPHTIQEWLNLLPSSLVETKSELILMSDMELDYSNLSNLLKAGKWKEADQETNRIMLKIVGREKLGWLDYNHIINLPCIHLCMIDKLWLEHSNYHFGFSIQKRIWLGYGGREDYKTECLMGDHLGWRKDGKWLMYNELNFDKNAPQGHLPVSWLVRWRGWVVGRFFTRFQMCKL
ncbi:MAG TPA: serine/threonine-protein kinase [Nostocaceae cyanobacterium]|nr:serine/threonine-protein kinase [Nostocaceae cyanobacterium]